MFEGNEFILRKKILTFFGSEFSITDNSLNLVLYAKQKAFKLREEIKLFSEKEMTTQIMHIKARNIIDFSATYDVFESQTDVKIGTLKRKGFKSMLRDEWEILDSNDNVIGLAREDSMAMALIRRFLANIIPQNYDVLVGDKRVMDIKQQFNPFVFKMDLIFEDQNFDKRLGFALSVLLGIVEGRQE